MQMKKAWRPHTTAIGLFEASETRKTPNSPLGDSKDLYVIPYRVITFGIVLK